jgi:hypothetical protein
VNLSPSFLPSSPLFPVACSASRLPCDLVVVASSRPRAFALVRWSGDGGFRLVVPGAAASWRSPRCSYVGSRGSSPLEAWDLRGALTCVLARVRRGGGAPCSVLTRTSRRPWRGTLRSCGGTSAPITDEAWDLSVACMLSTCRTAAEAPCSRRQMLGCGIPGGSSYSEAFLQETPATVESALLFVPISWFSFLLKQFAVSLVHELSVAATNSFMCPVRCC